MKVCIVYYSKTGKTRRVVEHLSERLASAGLEVRTFVIRPRREYPDKFLHLNPRIIFEVLTRRTVEIAGDEGFDLSACEALVVATPVWYGFIAPPVYSFISKYSGRCASPVYFVTTSSARIDYASRLRNILLERGFKVSGCLSVVSLEEDAGRIDRLAEEIARSKPSSSPQRLVA